MTLLLYFLGLVIGIAVLVKSADVFVDGSASLARRCGVSPLLIGMVIIGFGTSLPELTVSFLAGLQGNPDIALGNAYGSNTANIGLILGVTACIAPIAVGKGILGRELPILLGVTVLCGALLLFNNLDFSAFAFSITREDAILMLGAFAFLVTLNVLREKNQDGNGSEDGAAAAAHTLGGSLARIVIGLALVVGSSRLLVWCAVHLAQALGVPDLVIGLTIVAIGTSLPELASSIAAIRRHEDDLALGNVIGSNLFNTLAVVGLAAVVSPMTDAADQASIRAVMVRDYPVMILGTVFLLLVSIPFRGRAARITRGEGAFLLASYFAYLGWLAYSALH